MEKASLEEVELALDLQRWREIEYTELLWPKDHPRPHENSEHKPRSCILTGGEGVPNRAKIGSRGDRKIGTFRIIKHKYAYSELIIYNIQHICGMKI